MNCCLPSKDFFRPLERQSAPEFKNRNFKSKAPATNPAITSAVSVPLPPTSLTETIEERRRDLRVFSFSELKIATNGFDESLKIGEGGFGSVFEAQLDLLMGKEHKQWLAEVNYLSILNHPNLVKLLGYCSEDWEGGRHSLLVYEYMLNKSLEDHLFGSRLAPLAWKRRLEIMLGAAEGLAYMHGGSKIQVVGTLGYSAPEYAGTGRLTVKSDVYSFGVVLYEVLTGMRTLDRRRPPVEYMLVEWVQQYPADSNRFSRIIDPRLGNQYSLPTTQKIAKLAHSCLKQSPKGRPTMTEVVESLKEAIHDSGGASSPEHPHPGWPF